MGKYSSANRRAELPRKRGVHPLMRGIGCILMVVVPILSYGIAILLVNYGALHGWPIPIDWYGFPTLHPLLLRLKGIESLIGFLQRYPSLTNNLVANLVFAAAITIVIGGIMSMIFGYIYSIFGPPRYGPLDAPPQRGIRVKRYKR